MLIIKDWEYSAPYLILIGINYNLVCCKLHNKKPSLLWALGSIENNFRHSIFYNTDGLNDDSFKKLQNSDAHIKTGPVKKKRSADNR